VNSSDLPPDPIPAYQVAGYLGMRKISLRHFVVAVVAVGMGLFTWHRTGGDMILSTIVAVMTAAVVDIRVGDGPGLLRCRLCAGHGVDEVVGAAVGASGGAGDVLLTVAAVVSDRGVTEGGEYGGAVAGPGLMGIFT
jgi:hypothetical protein